MINKKLLENAARACGYKKWRHINDEFQVSHNHNFNEQFADWKDWTSLDNSGDCAGMNALKRIDTEWSDDGDSVMCSVTVDGNLILADVDIADHNNDSLAAWRYASTVVAGMMGEKQHG